MSTRQNIIINFPTNIGDSVMGLPVLDKIHASYPRNKITVIVSPRTKDLFMRNDFVDNVIVFNKTWKLKQKIRFSLSLRGKYDIIIDLKNSLLPIILNAKKRTPFYRGHLKNTHIKDSYLKITNSLFKSEEGIKKSNFNITPEEKKKWGELNLPSSLFIACSSLSSLKRYPYAYLKTCVQAISKRKIPLVILGEKHDKEFYGDILNIEGVIDLVGKTSFSEVFYLLKNYARLLLCVDSSILHLGSYIDIPIAALFGPTDALKSGPWSQTQESIVLKNNNRHRESCLGPNREFDYECMKIEPETVIEAVGKLWKGSPKKS